MAEALTRVVRPARAWFPRALPTAVLKNDGRRVEYVRADIADGYREALVRIVNWDDAFDEPFVEMIETARRALAKGND